MTAEEYKNQFSEYPEPRAKRFWVRDFHSMIVHTRGNHSKELIGTRRPNELKEILDYRIANDRAITRDSFVTAITNLQRTISHSAVEIRVPDELKEFIDSPIFEGTDFLSFIQRRVIKSMCEAANATLVWWPEGVGDTSRQVSMRPIIVMPEDIMHYTSEVFTFKSAEKSLVTFNKKEVLMGNVYYVMLRDELWKRVQVGKKTDEKYEWVPYYTNPIGEIYALPLGGDETSEYVNGEEVRYLTSYLSSAVPFADECKVQFSDHQGVMVNCSSPIREVEQISCTNTECRNGYVTLQDGAKQTCSVCNGTQMMPFNSNPYGILVRPKRQVGITDRNDSDIPMMRFLHPDTAILEFGNKSWRELLKDTENALNLLFVDEAQSGIAKNIDREDKLAWLDKVAVNVYKYLYTQSIQIIYKFRFPGSDYPDVIVNLPSTFVIKTETELVDDMSKLREQNAPEMVIIEMQREFVSKKFGGDPVRMKMFDTLLQIDPHSMKTAQEKAELFASGAITDTEVQLSNYAPGILSNYARQTPEFSTMTVDEIADAVIPLIEEKITVLSAIKPRMIG